MSWPEAISNLGLCIMFAVVIVAILNRITQKEKTELEALKHLSEEEDK